MRVHLRSGPGVRLSHYALVWTSDAASGLSHYALVSTSDAASGLSRNAMSRPRS